ncbi:IclR family transcriptional regulator [Falsirhodobacter halotolerans]|uniref:IclR family transcriptional regulator n=1 Tax=Falsirhodobacter halotolerans TaxID=1146892 RepID=UPI001FD2E197|nr:IclR family transcriptional regulator [Falsirhodobacter halotolerans]MCJ8140861.1 IclR family transcriptional regulator [Falsirhodobacter halotolerans]
MAEDIKLVPAVERAVRILDVVAASGPMGLTAISRALSIPKSSTHALCHTLCHLDLLREKAGTYVLGMKFLGWNGAVLNDSALITEFKDLLARTPALGEYTVTLSTLHEAEVIYLACQNSSAPLGVSFRIGMRLPAAFTATGKAMLAHLPQAELDRALALPLPPPLTGVSVQSVDALLQDIETTRARGFSIDNGQVRSGMCCLGAAVLDASGDVVAGVALSMTTAEVQPETIATAGRAMSDFARTLSCRIGFRE